MSDGDAESLGQTKDIEDEAVTSRQPGVAVGYHDSYFAYLTCTFSIVPLNLNGALL